MKEKKTLLSSSNWEPEGNINIEVFDNFSAKIKLYKDQR